MDDGAQFSESIEAESKVDQPVRLGQIKTEPLNESSYSAQPTPGLAQPGRAYRMASRCLDLVVSVPLLIMVTPLILVIAAAIRLDSPGPALFRHQRVKLNRRSREASGDRRRGDTNVLEISIKTAAERRRDNSEIGRRHENRFGEQFHLYKFRTMFVDAKERFPKLYEYEFTEDELNTVPIKVLVGSERGPDGFDKELGGDPRLTRVGRWLRRTSLDELPNLINVVIGDMALTGPRPDIAENVRHYRPEHFVKLNVKPGVTGLAQVNGRGHLSLHQTNEYDVEYIRHQSLWVDIRILLKTLWSSLKGRGAY